MADLTMDLATFSALTVHCTGCRNRTGVNGAVVLRDGSVCCRRCCAHRETIPAAYGGGEVELVG